MVYVDEQHPRAKNLVAYWPFVEGRGATRARDVTRNQYHGAFTGTPAWTALRAIDLPGSGDYIDTGEDTGFQLANGSISLWFQADAQDNYDGLIGKDAAGANDDLLLICFGNKLRFSIEASVGGTKTVDSDNDITLGQWYHAVVTWGSRGMVMYLDGVVQADTDAHTGGIVSAGNDFLIGNLRDAFEFNGRMDNVKVWSRELSAREAMQDRWEPYAMIRTSAPRKWWLDAEAAVPSFQPYQMGRMTPGAHLQRGLVT